MELEKLMKEPMFWVVAVVVVVAVWMMMMKEEERKEYMDKVKANKEIVAVVVVLGVGWLWYAGHLDALLKK